MQDFSGLEDEIPKTEIGITGAIKIYSRLNIPNPIEKMMKNISKTEL